MMPMQELSDVILRRKFKMAAEKLEILTSQLLFGHSTIELLDPENMGLE